MVATVTSNPEFEIKHVGNPRSHADKMKSLASPGTLHVTKEHVRARLLPDALDHDSVERAMHAVAPSASSSGSRGGPHGIE
jgi:hypothetical protein